MVFGKIKEEILDIGYGWEGSAIHPGSSYFFFFYGAYWWYGSATICV